MKAVAKAWMAGILVVVVCVLLIVYSIQCGADRKKLNER